MSAKVTAFILTAIMLIAVVPTGAYVNAKGENLLSFTVKLTDDKSNDLNLNDVVITLTDKSDENLKITQKTVNGAAVFENSLRDGATYSVNVSEVKGYEDVDDFEFVANPDFTEKIIAMTAIEKVNLSGVVKDEDGNPYANADVKLSGYVEYNKKTDENGKFTFNAYKGKDYKVTASVNDEKYDDATVEITGLSDIQPEIALELKVKEFSVVTNTTDGNNPTSETATVKYGEDKEINIPEKAGYRIESVKINGSDCKIDSDAKSYTTTISNIRENYTVDVIYVRKTYKIEFTVSENGKITYTNGESSITESGKVESSPTFDESEDPSNPTKVSISAEPNENYRVSKVTIDGTEEEFDENDKKYDTELTLNKDYKFCVEFKPNQYEVTLENDNEHGTAHIDKTKADHGGDVNLSVVSNEGYQISSIIADGAVIDYKEPFGNRFNYTFIVTKAVKITVKYSEIIDASQDGFNILDNKYYSVNFTKGEEKYTPVKNNNTYYIPEDVNVSVAAASPYKSLFYKEVSGSINNIFVNEAEPTETPVWTKITNVNLTIAVDKDAPEITNVSKKPNKEYHNGSYTITADVSDNGAGVAEAYYSKNDKFDDKAKPCLKDGKISFDTADEGYEGKYYIFAKDKVGNITKDEKVIDVDIAIDKNAPRVEKIEISADNINAYENVGYFCNSTVTVVVTATDIPQTKGDSSAISGVNSVTLYFGNKGQTTTDLIDGKAVFTIAANELKNCGFSVKVSDNAGNESEVVEANSENATVNRSEFIINKFTNSDDNIDITVTNENPDYTDSYGHEWYKKGSESSKFTVTVKADYGIEEIKYSLNGEETVYPVNINKINKEISFDVPTSDDNTVKNTLVVNAVSVTNTNADTKQRTVYVDAEAPEVAKETGFEITTKGQSTIEKIINALTFGTFCNEEIEITVNTKDKPDDMSSGVKEITLYKGEEIIATQQVDENNKSAFTVLDEWSDSDEKCYFSSDISVVVTDNVGNKSALTNPTTENSNIKNSHLMIETIKPYITEDYPEPTYKDGGREWYSKDITFSLTARDDKDGENSNSGIAKFEIKVNDVTMVSDEVNKKEENSEQKDIQLFVSSHEISTNSIAPKEDGSYTVTATVTDNAGNVYDTYSKTFYIDKNDPIITGFSFDPIQYNEGNFDRVYEANGYEKADYGYYFKEKTRVTVHAKDDAPSAGLAQFSYELVDISGETLSGGGTANSDGTISFDIDKNFKGQIYAQVNDCVGHTSNRVTPDSPIVEKPEKHNEENHISLVKENTTLHANDGTDLYAKNVPVTITVTDTYSGIRDISWSVVAPYDTENNQSGKITVDNNKKVSGTQSDEWKTLSTESNLVTKMQKVITVSNNSNNITVNVKMTDRAGNTTENKIEFSIDKTNPVIEVTYDNNTADSEYNTIYKDVRTATIKITERNFSGKDVDCKITNTDGVIPSVDGWQEHKNTQSPDQTYYTATVTYSADGDYTFDISYADLANNAANKIARHSFTVDRTNPKISVAYDNNDATNGIYYKADRTATITIVEHNFDASRVKVTGTAADNGTTLSFPPTSSWSDNGDVHTATIKYNFDSRFTFDIDFTDKAGNKADDYKQEEFYVDKTIPSLEFAGVEDKSANNGKIAPVITYTDNNIDRNTINVELSGANNGAVNYTTSTENILNGQKYIFADFAREQKVDDIYTLTATISDLAGNSSKKTITFSANRFGSVYSFDESLKKLDSKYTNAEQDVVFTETNVDTLDTKSLKLKVFKDGTPKDLKEGTDYTVTHTGGDGKWSRYKYVVKKELFANDGKYRVTAYSKDAAGNVNENIEESKKAEISFGIDKTKPVIVPIDFESEQQYAVEVKTVKVEIKDNLVLDNVKIYNGKESDGKEISYKVDGETYSFDINQSNDKQNVMFVAVDAAGNRCELSVKDVLVSTNMFVRWYNNTALFVGSIIGIAVFITAIAAFIIFGKKKKNN